MELRTPLCDLLGITYPIVLAVNAKNLGVCRAWQEEGFGYYREAA